MTTDQGEVLCSVLASDLPPVITEGDVEHVVELVFDLPVVANARGQLFGGRRTAGDVEGARDRKLFAGASTDDLDDGLQVGPRSLNVIWELADGHGAHE